MRRIMLCLAAAVACSGTEPSGVPRVLVDPILDSLFVGDTAPPRAVTFLDARGDTQATGPVRWSSADTAVAGVDSMTGAIAARRGGVTVVAARANGVTGSALVVVSRPIDLTLLLDTIYLMPGDTLTVPYSIRARDGAPPPVTFSAPTQAVFSIDAAGHITAGAAGGPVAFSAQADTVTATGTVEVLQLTDTLGGKGYFTIFGTVERRADRAARAVNYRRAGDTATFRLQLPHSTAGFENVVITLRDSVGVPGEFAIDSISPNEAFGVSADFLCRPARSWAAWSLASPPINALSRRFGSLAITSVATLANGLAVSGRFSFTAQRVDLYDNPLGAVAVRGTFVAPLTTDTRPCRS